MRLHEAELRDDNALGEKKKKKALGRCSAGPYQIIRSSFWTSGLHILDLILLDVLNSDEVGPSFQTVISAECKIRSTPLLIGRLSSFYYLFITCSLFLFFNRSLLVCDGLAFRLSFVFN